MEVLREEVPVNGMEKRRGLMRRLLGPKRQSKKHQQWATEKEELVRKSEELRVEINGLQTENEELKYTIQSGKDIEASLASKVAVLQLHVSMLKKKWTKMNEDFGKEKEALNAEILKFCNEIDVLKNMTIERAAKEKTLLQLNKNLKVQLENSNEEQQHLASKAAHLQLEVSKSKNTVMRVTENMIIATNQNTQLQLRNSQLKSMLEEVEALYESNISHQEQQTLKFHFLSIEYVKQFKDAVGTFLVTKKEYERVIKEQEEVINRQHNDFEKKLEHSFRLESQLKDSLASLQQSRAESETIRLGFGELEAECAHLKPKANAYLKENEKLSKANESLTSVNASLKAQINSYELEKRSEKEGTYFGCEDTEKMKDCLSGYSKLLTHVSQENAKKTAEQVRHLRDQSVLLKMNKVRDAKEQTMIKQNSDLCSQLERANEQLQYLTSKLAESQQEWKAENEELVKEKFEMIGQINNLRKVGESQKRIRVRYDPERTLLQSSSSQSETTRKVVLMMLAEEAFLRGRNAELANEIKQLRKEKDEMNKDMIDTISFQVGEFERLNNKLKTQLENSNK